MKTLAVALVTLTLAGGCVGARARGPIAVPEAGRIYVSVFVDQSKRGEIGVRLADALRVEIYRRDPSRLAMTFEDGSVAVDGTVLSVKEAPSGEGRLRIVVSAGARLVNRDGEIVVDLGEAEASGEYSSSRESAETEARRQLALESIVVSLARELVRRVDTAGRREVNGEQGGPDAIDV